MYWYLCRFLGQNILVLVLTTFRRFFALLFFYSSRLCRSNAHLQFYPTRSIHRIQVCTATSLCSRLFLSDLSLLSANSRISLFCDHLFLVDASILFISIRLPVRMLNALLFFYHFLSLFIFSLSLFSRCSLSIGVDIGRYTCKCIITCTCIARLVLRDSKILNNLAMVKQITKLQLKKFSL